MYLRNKVFLPLALVAAVIFTAPSCTTVVDQQGAESEFPDTPSDKRHRQRYENLEGGKDSILGDLSIGGPSTKKEEGVGGNAAVNVFLWRAALETLALGPLESADPFGGIIITDWFNLEEQPGAEYRVTAYILGRSLRTDNIKVAMYVRAAENGKTLTKRAAQAAERRLENLILTKARTIRATQYR